MASDVAVRFAGRRFDATRRLVADSTGETMDFGALESGAPTVVMRAENDDGDIRVCPVGTIRAVQPINRRHD
jgi:hypothetical protein